jgi:hypothetical protein
MKYCQYMDDEFVEHHEEVESRTENNVPVRDDADTHDTEAAYA